MAALGALVVRVKVYARKPRDHVMRLSLTVALSAATASTAVARWTFDICECGVCANDPSHKNKHIKSYSRLNEKFALGC